MEIIAFVVLLILFLLVWMSKTYMKEEIPFLIAGLGTDELHMYCLARLRYAYGGVDNVLSSKRYAGILQKMKDVGVVLGIIENCGCAHCANNYVYSVVLDIDKAKQFIILIGLARAAKKGPYGLNAHRLAHELLFNMAEVEEILVELEELEMVKKQGNVFTLGPKSGELLFPM